VKLSDIPDDHVIELASRWAASPDAEPGVVQALVDEGVPRKLAIRKVETLAEQDRLDYGVSPNYAWPT
jgi:hypothetical protein